MSYVAAQQALKRYADVGVRTGVESATPHRAIRMLMDGALARLSAAARHIRRGEVAAKGEKIGAAITIIGGLQSSLDTERGADIAINLNRLYDYMTRTLLSASAANDAAQVEHVRALLGELRAGWESISDRPAATPDER